MDWKGPRRCSKAAVRSSANEHKRWVGLLKHIKLENVAITNALQLEAA